MPKRRANGEGSMTKRKDGLWMAQYTDNTGKRQTLYGKTQQEVRLKLKEAIKQADMGVSIDAGKITLGKWLMEWLDIYCKPVVKKSTYALYYSIITQHLVPAFSDVAIKDLNIDMLQKFFNEKAQGGRLDNRDYLKGLSISTLKKMKRLLVSSLNQAVDSGRIAQHIAEKIKLPTDTTKEKRILSKDEQKRLELVVLKNDSPAAFAIYLTLYTGLRIGELLSLTINDIDFEKKELYVRRSIRRIPIAGTGTTEIEIGTPKTKSSIRTIPLPDFIIAKLKEYITLSNIQKEYLCKLDGYKGHLKSGDIPNKEFLFLSEAGTPYEQENLRVFFGRCLKKAGLEYINFHSLRHTFATRCIEAGFDVRSLSAILGHTDVAMTLNTYTHALIDQKKSNMNKLANIFEVYSE